MTQVPSNIVVEWDLDNDGDYDQSVENITSYVMSMETVTGRNWPSMLQGKTTPGQLVAVLNNSDDRFSYFNTSSPLTTSPYSLQTGRKIRARIEGSTITDPVVVDFDRFNGAGALGTTEGGATWTTHIGTTGGFTRVNDGVYGGYVEATGDFQLAEFDAGEQYGYAQIAAGPVDLGNVAGILYRFTSTSDYAAVAFDATTPNRNIVHVVVTGGGTTVTNVGAEFEPDRTIFLGVRVYDDAGTDKIAVYHEGVVVASNITAHTGTGTRWGLYADWPNGTQQRPPTFEEFWMWDKVRQPQGGELWQGKVSSIVPYVDNQGRKTAVLKAEGPLANVSSVTIRPPATLGGTVFAGRTPGKMIGNILGRCGELHPPEAIDSGGFTCGPVGYPDAAGLTLARRFEESDQGFIYETSQGGVNYQAGANRGGTSAATFTDDPAGSLTYETFELLDWRQEIINRVNAGVATTLPTFKRFGITADTAAGVANPVDITMPNFATDGAVAGDLAVVVIVSSIYTANATWLDPAGWRNYRPGLGGESPGQMRVYAKVLAAADLGKSTRFYADSANAGGSWCAWLLHFQNWRGSLADGLAIEVNGLGDPPTALDARGGVHDPPTLFVPWGREPSYFVVARTGAIPPFSNPVITTPADNITPDGYGDMASLYVNATAGLTSDTAAQICSRVGSAEVEDPTVFGGSFDNFNHLYVATIAVRGAAPETVTVNDLASQLDHNTIRTHTNPANIFPNAATADTYADDVLARYADDSPIVRISYTANRDAAHKFQAWARKLTDTITIEADNGAGMGVNGEYVIESIRHRWDQGDTQWRVTYECSAE